MFWKRKKENKPAVEVSTEEHKLFNKSIKELIMEIRNNDVFVVAESGGDTYGLLIEGDFIGITKNYKVNDPIFKVVVIKKKDRSNPTYGDFDRLRGTRNSMANNDKYRKLDIDYKNKTLNILYDKFKAIVESQIKAYDMGVINKVVNKLG